MSYVQYERVRDRYTGPYKLMALTMASFANYYTGIIEDRQMSDIAALASMSVRAAREQIRQLEDNEMLLPLEVLAVRGDRHERAGTGKSPIHAGGAGNCNRWQFNPEAPCLQTAIVQRANKKRRNSSSSFEHSKGGTTQHQRRNYRAPKAEPCTAPNAHESSHSAALSEVSDISEEQRALQATGPDPPATPSFDTKHNGQKPHHVTAVLENGWQQSVKRKAEKLKLEPHPGETWDAFNARVRAAEARQ